MSRISNVLLQLFWQGKRNDMGVFNSLTLPPTRAAAAARKHPLPDGDGAELVLHVLLTRVRGLPSTG